jgi:hypothetical protein
VQEKALKAVQNEDFGALLLEYLAILTEDVMYANDDKDVIRSKTHHEAVTGFGDWIATKSGR